MNRRAGRARRGERDGSALNYGSGPFGPWSPFCPFCPFPVSRKAAVPLLPVQKNRRPRKVCGWISKTDSVGRTAGRLWPDQAFFLGAGVVFSAAQAVQAVPFLAASAQQALVLVAAAEQQVAQVLAQLLRNRAPAAVRRRARVFMMKWSREGVVGVVVVWTVGVVAGTAGISSGNGRQKDKSPVARWIRSWIRVPDGRFMGGFCPDGQAILKDGRPPSRPNRWTPGRPGRRRAGLR